MGVMNSLEMKVIEDDRGELMTIGAERKGFEPLVQFYPHAALAKRCFRPLSHLSDLVES